MLASQFDINEQSALDALYLLDGVDVLYNGSKIRVMVASHSTTEGGTEYSSGGIELLNVLVRRYGSNKVIRPADGDEIVVEDEGVVKTFTLSQIPKDAFTQNEWDLFFRRILNRKKGSRQVVPFGGV